MHTALSAVGSEDAPWGDFPQWEGITFTLSLQYVPPNLTKDLWGLLCGVSTFSCSIDQSQDSVLTPTWCLKWDTPVHGVNSILPIKQPPPAPLNFSALLLFCSGCTAVVSGDEWAYPSLYPKRSKLLLLTALIHIPPCASDVSIIDGALLVGSTLFSAWLRSSSRSHWVHAHTTPNASLCAEPLKWKGIFISMWAPGLHNQRGQCKPNHTAVRSSALGNFLSQGSPVEPCKMKLFHMFNGERSLYLMNLPCDGGHPALAFL